MADDFKSRAVMYKAVDMVNYQGEVKDEAGFVCICCEVQKCSV